MPFRQQVKHLLTIKRYGWYAVRQRMLKHGATLTDVATVLTMYLRMLQQTPVRAVA